MFRSIRWTLQIWHAAILAMVLVAFGSVMFYYLPIMEYRRIDDESDADRLPRPHQPPPGRNAHRRPARFARAHDQRFPEPGKRAQFQKPGRCTTGVRAAPEGLSARGSGRRARTGRGGSREGADDKKTPSREAENEPGRASTVVPASRRTSPTAALSVRLQGDIFREGQGRRPSKIELPEDLKPLFDEEGDNPYFYIVWHSDGDVVLKSKFAPEISLPEVPAVRRENGRQEPGGRPEPIVRQQGEYREVVRQWFGGHNILVGRSIASDVASLHEKEGMVALVGIAVLAAGLLGGHFFARRVIRPIEEISATAADISLSNLSRRIDVTGTETELTGLARTLNQMFDRIESAFSQQVRFTADASHELRTPVAVILSHAELALDKPRPVEELRETIETCRRSALRMRSLIESLLTLARFDSGEVKLESRSFDLMRTVGDGIALVRPLADKRRITFQINLSPATATGDPDRIAQVITNLLTNAIRYNHDQGMVTVTLQSLPAETVLTVSDTGIGIPPEHLAHIFERFYRVDNARSRKDGGVGLGLAICKSIVTAHGGQISVSSHLNRGTKFEVRLPKAGGRPLPTGDDVRREAEDRRTDVLTAVH